MTGMGMGVATERGRKHVVWTAFVPETCVSILPNLS
jgi:hypothetical protein